MTTPRIEEQVAGMMSVLFDGLMTKHDIQDFLKYNLTEAHQAGIDEAVEIVQSLKIEGKNRHANDKTEDQRDYLNDWILPVIKKEIIKALQDNK